jgi:hypothetical protein
LRSWIEQVGRLATGHAWIGVVLRRPSLDEARIDEFLVGGKARVEPAVRDGVEISDEDQWQVGVGGAADHVLRLRALDRQLRVEMRGGEAEFAATGLDVNRSPAAAVH